MKQDFFVWDEKVYGTNDIVDQELRWGISNNGCFFVASDKDDMAYLFPPKSIERLGFLKPEFLESNGGCVMLTVSSEHAGLVKEKFDNNHSNIYLCRYLGWKELKKHPQTLINIVALANIMHENGIRVIGDYDKFYKMLK